MYAVREASTMQTITDTELELRAPSSGHNGSDGPVPVEDIDNLIVRIAAAADGDSIDQLTSRAGRTRAPAGALMLAAIDGRILAAASMSRREAVSEPTPSGRAASAVIEYTLANRERNRKMPRRAA